MNVAIDVACTEAASARLVALRGYGILDTPAEAGFDDIVTLASKICQTPVALVSFVDTDRQWFKANIGFDRRETPLDQSVCALVVENRTLLIIPDLTEDPRTRHNTLVTGAPFIRFYAGAPIETESGEVLGALCVIDTAPRTGLSDDQQTALRILATQVMVQLRLRAALRQAARDREKLAELNETLEQNVLDRTGELEKAQDALRQSQKMEAVGQLTGGLAHDFNNLLTAITGNLDLLSSRLTQGRLTDLERYIAAAQGATMRAAALTHRLLAFSRRQTLDARLTNVTHLVVEIADLIQRSVSPMVAVEIDGDDDIWSVLLDQNQFENVLLNLCINARDAMPDGGRLVIKTENRRLDQGETPDLPSGDYALLSVTDTGSGMSPEIVERIFEPFFTTKPLGRGTGLGLSMIYGFVRQSGGEVRVRSRLGHGTTMSLYFPRHAGGAVSERIVLASGMPPRARRGETVLVVDDEPSVRTLVTEALEDLGYTTVEATEGTGALRILQSDTAIDILVTDVGLLGNINGRQVADAGRALRPHLKVLFITGYAESALSAESLEAGMQVLAKPFSMDALGLKIREIIDA